MFKSAAPLRRKTVVNMRSHQMNSSDKWKSSLLTQCKIPVVPLFASASFQCFCFCTSSFLLLDHVKRNETRSQTKKFSGKKGAREVLSQTLLSSPSIFILKLFDLKCTNSACSLLLAQFFLLFQEFFLSDQLWVYFRQPLGLSFWLPRRSHLSDTMKQEKTDWLVTYSTIHVGIWSNVVLVYIAV